MKKILLYVILSSYFIFPSDLITNIKISGNTKTSSEIILSQIKHPMNMPFNVIMATDDQENIYNLNIFNFVNVGYIDSTYHILIQEKSNFSISPFINKNDVSGKGIGPKIIFNNIKGLGNQIESGITFGDIEHVYIKYINSLLNNKKSFYSIITTYEKNHNKIDNYDRTYSNFQFNYNFKNLKSVVSLSLGNEYNQLKYDTQIKESYNFIHFKIDYQKSKKTNNKNLKFNFNFSDYVALNQNDNYQKIFFKYNYNKKINNYTLSPSLVVDSHISIISNSTSPVYEFNYLGGDDLVRGYETDPALNDSEIADKLKFKNYIFNSIQFEIPLFIKKSFKTSMLFFLDKALGSNQYNNFDTLNKIQGYGFGYSFETTKNIRFDFCIGINDYGERTFHFIVKSNA